jgi:hypothetical protein
LVPSRTLETAADSPFVTTDQTDYKPGDAVVIFGSGWNNTDMTASYTTGTRSCAACHFIGEDEG